MNRKTWTRRRVLRAAGGIAVALPFLETFAPRRAFAAGTKRLGILFQCNGVDMARWWPKEYGALTAQALSGTALEPLGPHAAKLLLPRGLHMVPRGFGRDPAGGDDHMKGMGHKLTCTPNSTDKDIYYPTGPSLDYIVAKSINPGGKDPLNLAVGPKFPSVLHCAFYRGNKQPAPLVRSPWNAYQSWAGSGGPAGPATVDLAARRRKSVLDLVKTQLDALTKSAVVSADDKRRLDLHASSLRKLETAVAPAATNACKLGDERHAAAMATMALDEKTVTGDKQFPVVGELMVDIMALAMACDSNRVVTLQFGRGAGGPVYKWLGDELNQLWSHHALSHGNTTGGDGVTLDAAKYKQALFNIDRWHAQMLARLLDALSRYQEPTGSVLDNSAILFVNELSDGLAHSFLDLPVLVAGSAGGYLKTGQYLKVTRQAKTANDVDGPHNQLLTTIANAVGYRTPEGGPMTNFGTAPTGKPGEIADLKA